MSDKEEEEKIMEFDAAEDKQEVDEDTDKMDAMAFEEG